MMSLNEPQMQALGWIEDSLAGSDPRLASMLNIFSRLAADEEMPAREKIRVRHGRTAAHRPRRARRNPRRGIALPQALVAVALVLNTSGHWACIQSMGTACSAAPPHSMPKHLT